MAMKRDVLTSMLLLLIILTIGVFLTGCSQDQQPPAEQSDEVTAEEAEAKALDYVNNNLVLPDTTATTVSVEDEGSVYKVIMQYQGDEVPIFLSKDGETLYLRALNISTQSEVNEELSAEEAKNKVIDYVNENLVMPGTNASAVSVEEENYVYEVLTEYQGEQQSVYISSDGKYLFFVALNTSEELPEMTPVPTETATQPPYSTEELEQFVDCLNESGVEIYGRTGCPACQQQLSTLGGKEVAEPIYNDCANENVDCSDIEYVPTIIIGDKEHVGAMTIEELSKATNCTIG
ncbi:MAG: hypothetical protein ACOC5L_04910 [Halobacteriota archaeon]